MKKLCLIVILFSLIIFASSGCGGKQWDEYPAMMIDQNKDYSATIQTNYGDIAIELFDDEAPLAVNNFVFLAGEGFYNGVKFHRVLKGFVIQSGDPTGTGSGGPGYTFPDEEITREYVAGTVAMANSGTDTNGSQFFICLSNLTSLPKKYTIFGNVIGGVDVCKSIANVSVKDNGYGEISKPTVDVHINTIVINEE